MRWRHAEQIKVLRGCVCGCVYPKTTAKQPTNKQCNRNFSADRRCGRISCLWNFRFCLGLSDIGQLRCCILNWFIARKADEKNVSSGRFNWVRCQCVFFHMSKLCDKNNHKVVSDCNCDGIRMRPMKRCQLMAHSAKKSWILVCFSIVLKKYLKLHWIELGQFVTNFELC